MHLSHRELFHKHLAVPAYIKEPQEFVRAQGIYMYPPQGEPFVDLVSGVSVSNIGHCHPRVVEAVQQQAASYMHLMVYGEFVQSPQVRLAELLSAQLPDNLSSVYLVNSGSEANEGALKLAKRATGRTELIAFKKAYHGSTHGALSLLGDEAMKYAYRPLLPDVRFLDFNDSSQLEQISERTAAVLVESVQAEAGIILPKPTYLTALKARCQEVGALLILDDVQMGFGRTGKLFSFQNFDFVPDILTLAKGMGGGMPIGAFVASKSLMDCLQSKPALGHITTFGGHPVSAAAAIASLEVILSERLLEQAHDKAQVFVNALGKLPQVKAIRQQGLMLAIELENTQAADKAVDSLWKHRLIVDRFLFCDTAFRIAPPLTITMAEAEAVAKTVVKALKVIA